MFDLNTKSSKQQSNSSDFISGGNFTLQRKCSCSGSCPKCQSPLSGDRNKFPLSNNFVFNHPHDSYEEEADRIANQVISNPSNNFPNEPVKPVKVSQTSLIMRKDQGSSLPNSIANSAVAKTLNTPGKPLDPNTKNFSESRFGHDFSQIRIHDDSTAASSAKSIHAKAYTVNNDIVFGANQYRPYTNEGQHLLTHELVHTLQQKNISSTSPNILMGRWDDGGTKCSDERSDAWIERVEVKQETPQTVTTHWSDGTTETDECSSGKGHCCVDPETSSSGIACDIEGSRVNGSNCTPITSDTGYAVRHRDLDHNGIPFWTEFVPSRGIALHQYSPVDGTPLSHGCVRLNEDMARKIFCGVKQNQSRIQIHGFARPSCEHGPLLHEWEKDFRAGGRDLSQADGDRDAASIRETRRMLNEAFGKTLTVEEIRKLKKEDVPRCSLSADLPEGAHIGLPPDYDWISLLVGGLVGAGAGIGIGAAVGGLGGGILGGLIGGLAGLGIGALINLIRHNT